MRISCFLNLPVLLALTGPSSHYHIRIKKTVEYTFSQDCLQAFYQQTDIIIKQFL